LDIGARLKGFPCIFLQEDETFVKAEQLVFRLSENSPLKPFLHSVPREFGELEHFLKRLGATEKPTKAQVACILNSIHEKVGEQVLSQELETTVKYAMRVLFELFRRDQSAQGIDELYLPSQGKQLFKSCQMVCKVPPRFSEVVEKFRRPILLSFRECGLKKVIDEYIDSLPEHLRPVKLDELVQEEMNPECQVSICSEAQHGSLCSFQQWFQKLLQSEEFQVGLKRLLVHDHQNPQEFEHRMKKLQTAVETKCTGSNNLTIHLVDRSTNEVLHQLTDSCYAVQDEETWVLYMQHDFKDDKMLVSTVTCVNKILGDCIQKEKGMIAMLGCSSPSDIENVLNRLNITKSTSKPDDDDGDDDDYHPRIGGGGGGRGRGVHRR
jgi:hypothetical protein